MLVCVYAALVPQTTAAPPSYGKSYGANVPSKLITILRIPTAIILGYHSF